MLLLIRPQISKWIQAGHQTIGNVKQKKPHASDSKLWYSSRFQSVTNWEMRFVGGVPYESQYQPLQSKVQ